MLHLILVVVSMVAMNARAARPPKPPPEPICPSYLEAKRLIVGEIPETLEIIARYAAAEQFTREVGQSIHHGERRDVVAALGLADGSALFLVTVQMSVSLSAMTQQTYAVRVDAYGRPEVMRYDDEPTPPTAEQTPKRMIAHFAREAARERFPVGAELPGVWAGGGAPKITYHDVALIIPLSPDHGVALIDVHADGVTSGKIVRHAVAEIRDEELVGLTDLVEMKPAPEAEAPPRVTREDYQDAAKSAAKAHLIATRRERILDSSINAKVVLVSGFAGGDGRSTEITVDLTYVVAGFGSTQKSARFVVMVPETATPFVREEPTPMIGPQREPQPRLTVRVRSKHSITSAQATAEVRKFLAKTSPRADVRSWNASRSNSDFTEFMVTVQINMGSIGNRASFYRVTSHPDGRIEVTPAGAQG